MTKNNPRFAGSSAALILLALAVILSAACDRDRQREKSRAIEVGEVFITGAWKDVIEVVPGAYTLEDIGRTSLEAQITVRLRLKQTYTGSEENPAAAFSLIPLNANGAPLESGSAGMEIDTAEKFNEFARGNPGDTALITFQQSLGGSEKQARNSFAAIAGFDGRTIDSSKTTAADTPSAPAVVPASVPRNTDTDPIFAPRTEARTGRRIVAVPEFTATRSVSEDLAISFTAATTTGLAQNKTINRVIDYHQINRIMEQHRFEAGDWSNPAKYAEIGKALNVDTIAVGTISLGGKLLLMQQYVVSVQLIDISTMAVTGSFISTNVPGILPDQLVKDAQAMRVSQ